MQQEHETDKPNQQEKPDEQRIKQAQQNNQKIKQTTKQTIATYKVINAKCKKNAKENQSKQTSQQQLYQCIPELCKLPSLKFTHKKDDYGQLPRDMFCLNKSCLCCRKPDTESHWQVPTGPLAVQAEVIISQA